MKSDVNLTSSPLKAWANYLAWVSVAGDFKVVEGAHQCKVELQNGHVLKVQAATPDLLARRVMAELTSNFVAPPQVNFSTEKLNFVTGQELPSSEVSMRDPGLRQYEPSVPRASQEPRTRPVTSTKDSLQTIGVYVPVSMHAELKSRADHQGKKFSAFVRELVEDGYERFEGAIEELSAKKVLDSYEKKVASYSGEPYQWMARLQRSVSLELKLTAKEYGRSASQIVGGLLAEALSHCPQAQVVTVCDDADVKHAQSIIAGLVGPKAGALADYLELPGKRRLVNEILGGVVKAPGVLLAKIADYLEVSKDALAQAASLNFRQRPSPSFKAPNGQPRVLTEPVSWEEAVKALKLPDDEQAKLLAMGD